MSAYTLTEQEWTEQGQPDYLGTVYNPNTRERLYVMPCAYVYFVVTGDGNNLIFSTTDPDRAEEYAAGIGGVITRHVIHSDHRRTRDQPRP